MLFIRVMRKEIELNACVVEWRKLMEEYSEYQLIRETGHVSNCQTVISTKLLLFLLPQIPSQLNKFSKA